MQLVNNDCLMLHVKFKAVCTKCYVFSQSLLSFGDQAFWRGELCDKIEFNLDEM